MTAATINYQARQKPPAELLGHRGEISDMLERNMTLDAAAAFHLSNWGLGSRISILHEAVGHLVMGLLLHTHPKLMEGKPYQGSEEAEIYAGAIGDTIAFSCPRDWIHYFNDKQSFVDLVISNSKFYFVIENQNRVLSWLLAQSHNMSSFEIWQKCNFSAQTLKHNAKMAGIELTHTINYTRDILKISTTKYGNFEIFGNRSGFYGDLQNRSLQADVPDNLSGSEPLILFEIPAKEKISAIYDAVLPAIQFLQEKIYEIQIELGVAVIPDERMTELLKKITAGEVVGRLIDGRICSGLIGKGSQPEMNPTPVRHDVIRERDAALFAP